MLEYLLTFVESYFLVEVSNCQSRLRNGNRLAVRMDFSVFTSCSHLLLSLARLLFHFRNLPSTFNSKVQLMEHHCQPYLE